MQSEDDGDNPVLEFEDESVWKQPELALDQKETARIVQELLDCLSEEQRICIILRYIRQMKISEIALECGCTENTIKSRLNYARKRLLGEREMLEKKGVRLYNAAPFALLAFLLEKEASAFRAPAVPASGFAAVMNQSGEMGSSLIAESAGETAVTGGKSALVKWSTGKIAATVITTLLLAGTGLGILSHMQSQENATDTTDVTGNSSVRSEKSSAVEPTEEPISVEDVYYEYINQELVPQYGLAELDKKGKVVYDENDPDTYNIKENFWMNPSGLISACIMDFDQDEQEELFILYWEKEKNEFDVHNMKGAMYELEGDTVACKDTIELEANKYRWTEDLASDGNFSAIVMTAGDRKYLLFSEYEIEFPLYTGYNTDAMWTVEYRNGKFQMVRKVLTYTKSGKDVSKFTYTGITYDANGGKDEEVCLYTPGNSEYPYQSREEAYTGYFKEDGLDVSEIAAARSALVKLEKTENAEEIFTWNSLTMDESNKGSRKTAYMAMEGTDWTNLRNHIVE